MEQGIAPGIDEGVKMDVYGTANFLRFEHASGKADSAVRAAETFRESERSVDPSVY